MDKKSVTIIINNNIFVLSIKGNPYRRGILYVLCDILFKLQY